MQVEFDKIAEYMGELCGAARHDWTIADPSDVGLNGVPIKGWRAAYFEGCKDMAEGIASRLPEELRETVKEVVQAAFHKSFTEAAAAAQTESAGHLR
jgi:hypothetical protein